MASVPHRPINSEAEFRQGLLELRHLTSVESVAAVAGIRISQISGILAGEIRIDQEMAARFGYRRTDNGVFVACDDKSG
ncbi:MAG: hypothetical protein WBP85_06425 [Terracidiphilus sp.]